MTVKGQMRSYLECDGYWFLLMARRMSANDSFLEKNLDVLRFEHFLSLCSTNRELAHSSQWKCFSTMERTCRTNELHILIGSYLWISWTLKFIQRAIAVLIKPGIYFFCLFRNVFVQEFQKLRICPIYPCNDKVNGLLWIQTFCVRLWRIGNNHFSITQTIYNLRSYCFVVLMWYRYCRSVFWSKL